jgi:redox-sensitive bicupin YhaK (pirin superfamily)
MILLRRSDERGGTQLDWLDSRHSFSFGDYYDTRWMGFRQLRVINEDWIAKGGGFGTHPHRDMEILTYVVEGALEHKDSLGTGSIIRPGDVQIMSAGTGITHSEFNPSAAESVHLLQIWIIPNRKGLAPRYEQKTLRKKSPLTMIASPDGGSGSVTIHQDARIYAVSLAGQKVRHELGKGRHAWIQLIKGSLALNGQPLDAGDGAAVSEEAALELKSGSKAEALFFDLS